MPLTEAIEKASTAERTAGPIAVFSNSYARLPEHFFARLSPTAGRKAPPDHVQRVARIRAGGRYTKTRTGRVGGGVCRQRHAAGRRADRDGLCRASVRQFRSAAWRRSRNPPWRGSGSQWGAARYPVEGRGTNAILAARGWPRCIGAGPARISHQRSNACAREFRPRGRWLPSQRANLFTATASCLGRC